MDASEFLFPRDLAVTETKIGKVLLIGSCMAEAYLDQFRRLAPHTEFDWILFNNVMALPARDDGALRSYDFQYISLSLRHVVLDEIINFSGFLAEGAAEAVLARARQMLHLLLDTALAYNKSHGLLTFVANFFVPQVPVAAALDQIGTATDLAALIRRLNQELARLVRLYRNVYVADVDSVASSLGKRYFQDDVIGFYSHAHYWGAMNHDYDTSPAFNAPPGGRIDSLPRMEEVYDSQADQMFQAIWRQAECLYRTINQTDMVKLVIFDLDDTMWRGQIAEHYGDGMAWPVWHGWPVGLWEAVQHLRARGIMTAVCSKNEETLVRARWKRAVLPWIDPDSFTFREINWRPKAENIAKIIKQASVTPRSTVFVDDNPVERESVKAALPGIRVLGSNPHITRRVLLWSPETQLAFRSAETANREQSIRQVQFREADRTALSREDFLRDLECSVTVREIAAGDPEFARSFELLNKTNQFNTTGVRWTKAQINSFLDVGGTLFVFSVSDKYTDYGLVGTILHRYGVFAQVAMSCRVLGLEIETSVIHAIMRQVGGSTFFGRVFKTEANMVCRDLFSRCGFQADAENDELFVWRDAEIPDAARHLSIRTGQCLAVSAA